eukprot:COSAG04_NODE_2338_length_4303_cov_2.209087_2_plen_292_part_00
MLGDSQTPFASFDRRNGVFDVQVEGTVWAKQPECCVPKDLDAGRQGVTAFVECILGRQPPVAPAPPPPPGCLSLSVHGPVPNGLRGDGSAVGSLQMVGCRRREMPPSAPSLPSAATSSGRTSCCDRAKSSGRASGGALTAAAARLRNREAKKSALTFEKRMGPLRVRAPSTALRRARRLKIGTRFGTSRGSESSATSRAVRTISAPPATGLARASLCTQNEFAEADHHSKLPRGRLGGQVFLARPAETVVKTVYNRGVHCLARDGSDQSAACLSISSSRLKRAFATTLWFS